jgi:uridine phosphorylase
MIQSSELILNPNGSVYHLNLLPEHIANDIIFVGDQNRVEKITQFFDSIEFSTQKREFKTQTGLFRGKRITVMSTGIGPDNIDIVMNEVDALVNIDLKTRNPKDNLTSLNIIRIGTSGSLQAGIPVDSFVMSKFGLGLDNMLRSYLIDEISDLQMEDAFIKHTNWDLRKGRPYVISCSEKLEKRFESDTIFKGITGTAGGFYGPQGRMLRLNIQDESLN